MIYFSGEYRIQIMSLFRTAASRVATVASRTLHTARPVAAVYEGKSYLGACAASMRKKNESFKKYKQQISICHNVQSGLSSESTASARMCRARIDVLYFYSAHSRPRLVSRALCSLFLTTNISPASTIFFLIKTPLLTLFRWHPWNNRTDAGRKDSKLAPAGWCWPGCQDLR